MKQTQRLWEKKKKTGFQRRRVEQRDKLGHWHSHMHTIIYKIDNLHYYI